MNDYISRTEAINAFPDLLPNFGFTKKCITEILQGLPSVQPKKKTGRWIDNHNGTISCSRCQTWFYKDNRLSYMHHCPNCSAKMESEGK